MADAGEPDDVRARPSPARRATDVFLLSRSARDTTLSFPFDPRASRRVRARHALTASPTRRLLARARTQGLTAYERLRAARIAANNEMMRRLRLPELGSELRPPSTPSASGAAGAAGAAGQYAPAKRRSPKGLPSPNATPKSRKREFRMVLRVRKEVNYAEVADDDPKQRLPKVPRISDDSAGARRRAAATVDPDTKLENLDSKYANDLDARNRAIRSVVRTRSLPAPFLCFLERRRRRRRRTAVRVSLAMTTRAPDAFICFARRRRCGTPTRRNGSRSRASRGGSSARSSARRARPRQRLLPPRASAGRWPSTNASRSARRAALRARRATTSRTPSRPRRRRRPPCLPREVARAGVSASPARRGTRRLLREPRSSSRWASP